MRFLHAIRTWFRSFSRYQPMTQVFISQANIVHNLNEYRQQYPGVSFAPVLKSNAYGHGLVPVARILDNEPIAFLVVDSLYEARVLRGGGVQSPILVLGYVSVANINLAKRLPKLTFVLTSLEQIQQVITELDRPVEFHLKIDTGMHRQGIVPEQFDEAIRLIRKSRFIRLTGMCSHLADADNEDEAFTLRQIDQWERAVEIFKQAFPNLQYFHLSATKGTRFSEKISANVVRLGIGLYGIDTSPASTLNLWPALRLETIVGAVRTIPAGDCVGYNATYRAEYETRVATLPAGYFEGVDRRLSNKGCLRVAGVSCPIVGRVSMNMTCIDVTNVPNVKLEDTVVVVSENPTDENSVCNLAVAAGTIPYEILIHIPQHLRRTVE